MFERFTDKARRVVVLAQEEARLLNHNYIGTEHILLGLLHEGQGVAAEALTALGVSLATARVEVQRVIGHGPAVPSGHIPFTPRAKKVLELSLREAMQLGHSYIGTEHILLGVLREGEGVGAQVLIKQGADLATVRHRVIELLSGSGAGEAVIAMPEPPEGPWPTLRPATRFTAVGPQPGPGAPPTHCGFCGRDLWEAERYVRAQSAVICDTCIAAAQTAVREAPPDSPRQLSLPPRIFGSPPDDPQTVSAIEQVLRTAFTPVPDPYDIVEVIEDGEAIAPILAEAGTRVPNLKPTDIHVERIRFLGPDEAEVRFVMQITEIPNPISFDGRMVRRNDRWLVSRDTISRMVAPTGVQVPPPDVQT